jgi:hypothetical protein
VGKDFYMDGQPVPVHDIGRQDVQPAEPPENMVWLPRAARVGNPHFNEIALAPEVRQWLDHSTAEYQVTRVRWRTRNGNDQYRYAVRMPNQRDRVLFKMFHG